MMPAPILEVRNLSITLPAASDRAYAVKDMSFDLGADEILCIVGESGSGKSMLAKAIMGLLPGSDISASEGEIRFGGKDLLRFPDDDLRQLRGNQIAMIFQEPMTALNPLMTIGDQIAEVLRVHETLSASARKTGILEMLNDVHLPDPNVIYGAYPHQLSGGQRQRAMIAMALILKPRLIIADEPTTALDVTTQAQILELIAAIQRDRGTGLIFITHDFGVVAEIADRVGVMQYGELVEIGCKNDVLNRPRHAYTRALISAVPGLASPSRASVPDTKPAIVVKGLYKEFSSGGGLFGGPTRKVRAVSDVSLSVARGETLGIVGESGSGKSTLARLIIRLIEADEGSIHLDGNDIRAFSKSDLREFRKRIQMIFQDPFGSLNPRHRIGHIIGEGLMLHGMPGRAVAERTAELLKLVGLDPAMAERFPHEFSGGQRQRVGIARALAQEPEYLIADEPVSALDVSVQEQVLELLRNLQQHLRLTMIFITHDLCVAAQICDRIAVMRNGEIVEHGPTEEILDAPTCTYTQALLDSLPGRQWLSSRD